MTDTERLATDRAYWDEVAPEGAEAFINEEFTMRLGSREFSFDDGEWVKECISWPLSKYVMDKNFTVSYVRMPQKSGMAPACLRWGWSVSACSMTDG